MASKPIELALNRPDASPAQAARLRDLVGRLLDLLAEHVPDHQGLKSDDFRRRLERYQRDLEAAVSLKDTDTAAAACVEDCDRFLKEVRKYGADREAEFVGVIDFLRQLIETVKGDAKEFQAGLDRSTAQFARLVDLEDIRQIKTALAREVVELKRVVAEREKKEQAQITTLVGRMQTLEANLVAAKEEAQKDGLTAVANRKTFDRTLPQWLAASRQNGGRFALAMIDLDNFKVINDTHGHQVGDRVLVCAARLFEANVRATDVVSRYGGEEFAILFAGASAAQARARLAAMMGQVAPAYEYQAAGQTRHVSFTFSVGLTEFQGNDTADSIVRRADEALYEAKRRGKNRIEMSGTSFLKRLLA